MVVTAVVLAVTIEPIFLMFLLIALEMGDFSAASVLNSQERSEKEEAMVSFTETGKGFFAGASGAEPEKEKEAEKSPWYWPFGGNDS